LWHGDAVACSIRLVLRGWNWMLPSGFVAMLAGWYVVEIGRQPWVVYRPAADSAAVTPTLSSGACGRPLSRSPLVYAIVFGAGIWYLLQLVRRRRRRTNPHPTPTPATRPRRAVVAAESGGQRGGHLMEYWLPVAWFGVIGFGVLMYVLLDGFVLGLGILAPFAEDEAAARPHDEHRRAHLGRQRNLAGARRRGLARGVPEGVRDGPVGAVLPVLLMLIALVFRGVAFEFRFKAGARSRPGARRSRSGRCSPPSRRA
jgi:hypothetical protein